MAISRDLFLAILAMDSYNRGYDAGLADGGDGDPDGLGLSSTEATYWVGSARVGSDEFLPMGAKEAGFYAVAYRLDDGMTVISYRGTDTSRDHTTGWLVGAGATLTYTQADETLAFYEAVTGQSTNDGPAANTIVTGHSLGGGLAGHVSALTGRRSI